MIDLAKVEVFFSSRWQYDRFFFYSSLNTLLLDVLLLDMLQAPTAETCCFSFIKGANTLGEKCQREADFFN